MHLSSLPIAIVGAGIGGVGRPNTRINIAEALNWPSYNPKNFIVELSNAFTRQFPP